VVVVEGAEAEEVGTVAHERIPRASASRSSATSRLSRSISSAGMRAIETPSSRKPVKGHVPPAATSSGAPEGVLRYMLFRSVRDKPLLPEAEGAREVALTLPPTMPAAERERILSVLDSLLRDAQARQAYAQTG
jgi:hypothetical protein